MNSLLLVFLAAAPLAEAISDQWESPTVILGKLAVIFALVVLNGFFVACEFAIVKVRGSQLDPLVADGNLRAAFAQRTA